MLETLEDGSVRLAADLPPFVPGLRTDRADAGAWVHRVDRGELLGAHLRADGTLLVEGYAARAGILEYRNRDGSIRRELVLEDTLADAAAGLARATVTLDHPDPATYPDGVTPDNVKELGVGDTDGEVAVHDGGFVRVKMAVRRRDAIDAVRGGTRELSHGYRVRIDPTPGTHPVYGRYDARQLARETNHLAIVPNARGGSALHVRVDAAVATTVISPGGKPDTSARATPRGGKMNPRIAALVAAFGLTGRYDSDEAALDAVNAEAQRRRDSEAVAERARADAATATATTHRTEVATLTASRDAEKARADRAEAELATLRAAEKARLDAAERVRLDGIATAIGIDPKAHADTKALARAIAEKQRGSPLETKHDDAYVRAMVDIAADAVKDRADGLEAGRQAWAQAGQAGQGKDGEPREDRREVRPRSTMNDRWSGQPVSRGGDA